MQREGKAIAQEVKALGRDMILGPTVNINRVPLWGRNFEGYGEDPYLAAQLGVAYIKGVQGEGVIPSVKHFAANNEEFERHRIDATHRRAHAARNLPAGVQGRRGGGRRVDRHVGLQQGEWRILRRESISADRCSEEGVRLQGIRDLRLGQHLFDRTDGERGHGSGDAGRAAGEGHAARASQQSGNSGGWLGAGKVLAEIKAGHITEATLDDNVGRILRVIFLSGLFDHPHAGGGEVDTPEQRAVALQGATEGIVLLKNKGGLLPLDRGEGQVDRGDRAKRGVARNGRRRKFAGAAQVCGRAAGWNQGEGRKRSEGDLRAGRRHGGRGSGTGHAGGAGQGAEGSDRRGGEAPMWRWWLSADTNKIESEGFDLKTMDLPAGQDELIQAVEKANPHTVVVLNTGDPVTMTRWIDTTPALLDMWYGGQEGGDALAAVLFGDANPSGKLPVSLPKKFEDSPACGHYPGENLKVDYAEGIYVGYRYYDTKNVEPQFPFGFGMSYTTFEYANLR